MQTMDSTLRIQVNNSTKRNISTYVLNALCLTIFPLIYFMGKTLLYFMHLIMDAQALIPSPNTF